MKYILLGLIFVAQTISAQKLDKGDKKVIQSLQTTINFLADDKLEGRRTGSVGEKLAYEFIQKEFKKIGLQAITTDKTYIQAFDVNEGREFEQKSKLIIGDIAYTPNEHFFPLSFSGNLSETKLINIEKEIAFIDIGAILKENENNPHFDLKDKLISVCTDQASKNRKLVIFRNSSNIKDDLNFDAKDKTMPLPIAAIFVKNQLKEKFDDGLIYATLTINIVSKIKHITHFISMNQLSWKIKIYFSKATSIASSRSMPLVADICLFAAISLTRSLTSPCRMAICTRSTASTALSCFMVNHVPR